VPRIIDVSDSNGTVDFHKVAQAGIVGAWVKATEGRTFTAHSYKTNLDGARAAGIAAGAYHFARPDNNAAKDEAAHFLSQLDLKSGDLRPVLDFEHRSSLSAAVQVQWARDFNQAVFDKIGVFPVFYSFSSFIEGLDAKEPIGNGLWLANYGKNDGAEHPATAPHPWQHFLAHQFTSNGQVSGVSGRCDISVTDNLAALLFTEV
jgi:lysozyme